MRKYFRLGAYIRRLKLVPGLASSLLRHLKDGRPLVITRKYEAGFEDVFSLRDPTKGVSLTKEEAFTLYSCVLATRTLDGAIAEFGVHKGGSARILCEVECEKDVFLLDTFEGMPDEQITRDKDKWEMGSHRDTTIEDVSAYLSGYTNVHYIRGVFPDSLQNYPEFHLEDRTFSFVHLDVDLYKSTLDALEFFYPRMSPFGRIVSHNYQLSTIPGGDTPGVKAAFMEYFEGREHFVIEIADTQCLVVKPVTE